MPDIKWTKEQTRAIRTVDGEVLLTAAAGAGKTAVLAQRCIYLLTDAARPCNINELLVLTYTEAAAAEMRRRIAAALTEKVRSQPSNAALHRQLNLLDKASISTIHSFCRSVLAEFFYRLPLDPNFEMLDADEADLLKAQIARELFEDYYARTDAAQTSRDFSRLAQSFGSAGDDRSLIHLLIRLHNFQDHLRDHQLWVQNCRQQLQIIQKKDIKNLAVVKNQKQVLQNQIDRIINRLEFASLTTTHFPQLDFYTPYIKDYLLPLFTHIKTALAGDDFAAALNELDQLQKFQNAPRKPKELDLEDVAPVKDQIDKARADFKMLRQNLNVDAADVLRQAAATAPLADLLINLHEEFTRRYQQAKQQASVLDFSDLEHLCLQLLHDKGRPSDVARQLRDRFRFILVDEYQDISPVQEAIIQYISRTGPIDTAGTVSPTEQIGNLFMVGDVKQSIYGFRQADPSIFLDKFNRFTPLDPQTRSSEKPFPQARIDLNRNFRSRRAVINAVNYIFSRCMTAEFTGIDYFRDSQLVYGAQFYDAFKPADGDPSAQSTPLPVELHLIERQLPENTTTEPTSEDTSDRLELDAVRREALIIARRIQQMVGADQPEGKPEFNIIDPDTDITRPVTYRDIVILLRSMKMRAELFSEVFTQLNVPAHAELTSGYFVATEIQDMISLLKLLDNPQQDIPLASVLRSPIVSLNESQLTAIRLYSPDHSYYHAIRRYAQTGPEEQLKQKLNVFLNRLEQWRSLSRRDGLAPLIWRIYRDTHLLAYVSGLGDGRQRYRNLLHLHDRARQYDNFAGRGLARFLRFIEKLRAEEGDFGPAPVLTEADNVVRIMSVHKSKGLEFPVVILADLARRFNKRDVQNSVLFDRDQSCPVGLRVIDGVSRDRWPTVAHRVVAENIQQRFLAEEMRILYVAMTRARERLLLCASIDLSRFRSQWQSWRFHPTPALPEFILAAAAAPVDWLGAALAAHPDLQDFLSNNSDSENCPQTNSADTAKARFAVNTYLAAHLGELLDAAELGADRPQPKKLNDLIPPEKKPALNDDAKMVIDRINWRYPHQTLTALPARTSATELKRQININTDPDFAPEKPTVFPTPIADPDHLEKPFQMRPRFLSDQPAEPTAAEIGAWTHLFLQRLDLEQTLDETSLTKQLKQLVHQGVFTDHQRRHIRLSQVAAFFTDPLGRRLLQNRATLQREWPFTLALPAHQVYPAADLHPHDKNETVIIRGIIDCLFETEKGIVIIDFKTDQIGKNQCAGRADFYTPQLLLYRRAVETILKRSVTEMYLYFLTPGVAIPVPLPVL